MGGQMEIELETRSRAWFALYTRHRHERAVADFLDKEGVEVFVPLYNARHRWKDRVKQLSLPLFPNYVFVFSGADERISILRTPGVYDFVRLAGRPSPIPNDEIAAVRKTMDNGLAVDPHPFLNIGDRVRGKSGPLKGVEGILVRKSGHCHLVLSVELLGRSVAVEVDAADFERESRSNPLVCETDFLTSPGGHRALL
ncbi:MAG TPA: UpxY family transcription antiterminator [Terriglobia bacterium]|nr:UpxY family transcription antiterminator [Terriglobia bacterium]